MRARRWMKIGIIALVLCVTLQPLSTVAAPAGVWIGLTNESHRALAYHVTDARGSVVYPQGGISPWLLINASPGSGGAPGLPGQWLEWGESTGSGIVNVRSTKIPGGCQVLYFVILPGMNLGQDQEREPLCAANR